MTSTAHELTTFGVAEAKRRFSELLDRVGEGERIVIQRRGHSAAVLVPATADALQPAAAPIGLAPVAGALSDWDDLEPVSAEIDAARRARDRPVPDLG